MPFLYVFLIAGSGIIFAMALLWLMSLPLQNASIADIFWGISFIIITWLTFELTPQGYLPRKILIGALVTIWGLRLAIHLSLRSRNRPEDFRYAGWRAKAGNQWWWVSFVQVFLLQGVLVWLISAPVIATQTSGFPAIITPLDWLGVVVWTIGVLFEATADAQLMRFKADPANNGKLLTQGLWKYTRHPNYFGEALVWWGFYIIALAAGRWWTIFSPMLMTFLLLRVSGVAMLERTMKNKPGFEEYKKTTSAFFPRLPKS